MQSDKFGDFYVWVFASKDRRKLTILKENFEAYYLVKPEDVGLGKTKPFVNSGDALSVGMLNEINLSNLLLWYNYY